MNKNDIKSIEYETLTPYGTFFREVSFGNYCSYQIGKNAVDTILNYRFDCKLGAPFLPYFLKADSENIVLIRSCGSMCGSTIIYTIINDKIYDSGQYENVIALDLRTKRVVYSDVHSDVTVLNYVTGKKQIVSIPFPRGEYGLDEYEGNVMENILEIHDAEGRYKTKLKLIPN